MREKLNNLLPPLASRFTAIRRSLNGNLICYTLGTPTSTIESLEEWSPEIEYKAIRINAEDKWTQRIVYMASPCTSATIFEAELKEYNPGISLAANPRLLSPTVAPLLFPGEREILTSVFAFATYRRLADYNMRPPSQAPGKERPPKGQTAFPDMGEGKTESNS